MSVYSKSVIKSNGRNVTFIGGQSLNNVHTDDNCFGSFCPIHKASDHEFVDMPLTFDGKNMVRTLPDGSVIPDPDDYGYNKGYEVIIRNSAKCLDCNDEIESEYRHDYVACECGNVFVDGGKDYIRHGFLSSDRYENTSVTFTKGK